MEILYKGLPLSLQQAYSAFFAKGDISLESYQVNFI